MDKLKDFLENHRSLMYSVGGVILFLVAGLGATLLPSRHTPQTALVEQQTQQFANPASSAAVTANNATTPVPEFVQEPAQQEQAAQVTDPEQWCLYITGSVRRPDVYYLPKNSRLHHLVEAAGGFDGFADREAVNLASTLQDGLHVHIPRKSKSDNKKSSSTRTIIVTDTPVFAPGLPAPVPVQSIVPVVQSPTPVQNREQTSRAGTSQRPAGPVGPININRATEQELQLIKGIGPVLAARIVEYRQKHGNFSRVEDITKVKGIGSATFKKLKDQITIR